MDKINYDGYEIEAKPHPLTGRGWQLGVTIIEHRGGQTHTKPFSAGNTFYSREEAVQQCFEFGKRIINGMSQAFR